MVDARLHNSLTPIPTHVIWTRFGSRQEFQTDYENQQFTSRSPTARLKVLAVTADSFLPANVLKKTLVLKYTEHMLKTVHTMRLFQNGPGDTSKVGIQGSILLPNLTISSKRNFGGGSAVRI